MRSAIAVVAALLVWAGTMSGRLSAEDQPTVQSYPVFRALLGGSGGSEAQAGYAVAAGPSTDSVGGPQPAPSDALGNPVYMLAQGPGNAPAYAQQPAFAYPPGYNGQNPALAFRPGYNASAYVGGSAPTLPGYGPPDGPAYFAPGYPAGLPATACGDANCYVPCLTVTAAAVLLHRANLPKSRMLAQDLLSNDTVIDARSLRKDLEAGPRIDAVWQLQPGWQLEGVFFSTASGTDTHSADGVGIAVPALNDELFFYQYVTARYKANVYSGEISVRHQVSERINLLMGFRFVELREVASLVGFSDLGSASATSKLFNDMSGFQIGANVALWRKHGPLRIDSFVKGGVYGNAVTRWTNTSGIIGDTSVRDNSSQAAFVGEVAVLPTYEFNDHFAVYGGYEAMWLEAVALAPDQLGVSGPIRASRTLLYHVALAGVKVRW
jgi:hypothetical protein